MAVHRKEGFSRDFFCVNISEVWEGACLCIPLCSESVKSKN